MGAWWPRPAELVAPATEYQVYSAGLLLPTAQHNVTEVSAGGAGVWADWG